MNQFQALVHALLEARDMTVAELARQSGLHEQTLYKLLRGRRDKADVSKQRIDPDTVDAIAQVLGSRTQLHRAAAQARGYVIEELPDSIDPDFDALIVLARDASPERLEIAKNVLRAALNESRPD